jgi:hypothetical protein
MIDMFSRAKKEFNGPQFFEIVTCALCGIWNRETAKSLRVSHLHFKPGELFSRRIVR